MNKVLSAILAEDAAIVEKDEQEAEQVLFEPDGHPEEPERTSYVWETYDDFEDGASGEHAEFVKATKAEVVCLDLMV